MSSSKAVFLSMANSGEDEGVHLALTPTLLGLPPLEERQMEAISQELQLQLLMCRVRNLDEVREFSPASLVRFSLVVKSLATSGLASWATLLLLS